VISKIRALEAGKAAEEVTSGLLTLPIDPFKIAESRGIMVEAMNSSAPGISGFLMKSRDAFGIGYSNRIQNPGYVNFTVSHELGHYFISGHVEKLFTSGAGTHASRSGFVSDDPCEREADFFASSLLMPCDLFRKALRSAGEGFRAVQRLSDQCVTSITATAIRFAEFSDEAVAVIVSTNGVIDFCCLSPTLQEMRGITWIRQGDPIPATSTTARFSNNSQNVANSIKREGYSMLDEWMDGAPPVEVKEDVVGLGHYGKTLTLLFTSEDIEADEIEDYDSFERWQRRR
jgi:Zn-dependent peptidase ImmA (M78 family)